MSGPTKPARWRREEAPNGSASSIVVRDGRSANGTVIASGLDHDIAFRIVECVNGCNDENIDDPEAWMSYAKACVRVVELAPSGDGVFSVDTAEEIIRAYTGRSKPGPAAELKETLEIAGAAAAMDERTVQRLLLTATRDQLREAFMILVSHQAILAPPDWLAEKIEALAALERAP